MKVIYSNDRKQNITRERNAQEERCDQIILIEKMKHKAFKFRNRQRCPDFENFASLDTRAEVRV